MIGEVSAPASAAGMEDRSDPARPGVAQTAQRAFSCQPPPAIFSPLPGRRPSELTAPLEEALRSTRKKSKAAERQRELYIHRRRGFYVRFSRVSPAPLLLHRPRSRRRGSRMLPPLAL